MSKAEIIRIVLDSITLLILISFFLIALLTQKKIFRHISHLYVLCDILVKQNNPFVVEFYDKIRKRGPKKISNQELYNIAREQHVKQFKKFQEKLEEMKKTAAPEELNKIEKKQKTINEIFTLLETIGPDTSSEYAEKIIREIIYTIEKDQSEL